MIYGADTQHLRDLATAISNESDRLLAVEQRLSNTVATSGWEGADAVRFRDSWSGDQRLKIRSASELLRSAADRLRANADEQDQASGVAGPESVVPADVGVAPGDVDLEALGPAVIPVGGSDRDVVAGWWNSLSEEDRRDLLESNPGALGNLEGIPISVRYEANRAVVESTIAQYRQSGQFDEAFTLTRLLDEEVLFFDAESGHVAVVHGDLETASEVAIAVQGTGGNLDKFVTNFGPEGDILRAGSTDRAVISTLVWDPPPGVPDNMSIEQYTPSFVNGPINQLLSTAGANDAHVVLVGHSAGTLAIQELLLDTDMHTQVDGVVLLAPPVLNTELVDRLGDKHLFIGMHTEDPLNHFDGSGHVDDGLGWEGDTGHSMDEVVAGKRPWDADTVRWGNRPSGLGVDMPTDHHGNSLYYQNFYRDMEWVYMDRPEPLPSF